MKSLVEDLFFLKKRKYVVFTVEISHFLLKESHNKCKWIQLCFFLLLHFLLPVVVSVTEFVSEDLHS